MALQVLSREVLLNHYHHQQYTHQWQWQRQQELLWRAICAGRHGPDGLSIEIGRTWTRVRPPTRAQAAKPCFSFTEPFTEPRRQVGAAQSG